MVYKPYEFWAITALIVFAFCSWVLFSCTPPAPMPPAPADADAGDMTIDDSMGATDSCARACRRLAELGCWREAGLDGRGLKCAPHCRAYLPLVSPECVASSRNVGELNACNVACVR